MRTMVLDGGGQLGCFVWGVLIELYKLGLRPNHFNNYVATSAGVFNSAYFVGEQIEEGLRIWSKHLPRNFWKWYKNDMDYLEAMLRYTEPLKRLPLNGPQIYAVFSNPRTLCSETVCLNNLADPIEAMLASAAMPILTGPRLINGMTFYDAGLISQPPIDHIPNEQDSETWVLQSTPKGYRLNSLGWNALSYCAVHDPVVRRLLRSCPKLRNKTLMEIESNSKFKVIQPEKELPISWRSRDEEAIAHTIKLGREAGVSFAKINNW